MDVTLRTPLNVYTISSDGHLADSGSSFGHGLYGAISWPVSRFRIAEGFLLEQQMFLSRDESTVAMSWAIRGDKDLAAQLMVRPFFSGCGPRSYRDIGFHLDPGHNTSRFTWLPNVRGPKVFADTNGQYRDETTRLFGCRLAPVAASSSEQALTAPGRFEFELSRRPSVLIFSVEDPAVSRSDHHIGLFLAGLMERSAVRAGSAVGGSVGSGDSTAYSSMINSRTCLTDNGHPNATPAPGPMREDPFNRAPREAYRKSDQTQETLSSCHGSCAK